MGSLGVPNKTGTNAERRQASLPVKKPFHFSGAMDSQSLFHTPKPALPFHLINSATHSPHQSSPLGRISVTAKERDGLTASIKSSHHGRQPIDLDGVEGPRTNGHTLYPPKNEYEDPESPTDLDVTSRDPRDEAQPLQTGTISRPASPYTLNPPIDFDGLSWPSE